MTTPAEFLQRVLATVDDLALRLSHTPHDRQDAFLKQFEGRVKAQWRETFSSYLSSSDVEGMVDDLMTRVRKRRDAIELAEVGTA